MAELIPNIVGFFVAIATFAVTILVLYRLMSKDMRERFDDMRNDMKERFDAMSRDTKERFDRVEGSVKELKSDLKADIGRLDSDIKRLETDLRLDIKRLETDLRLDIRQLQGDILKIAMGEHSPQKDADVVQGTSPIVLTPKGQRIAEATNAQAIVEKYADRVEIPENATRLEIQFECFRFALMELGNLVNQEEKYLIDEAIFEQGTTNPNVIYKAFGVLLRDYHLRKRGLDVPVRKAKEEQPAQGEGLQG